MAQSNRVPDPIRLCPSDPQVRCKNCLYLSDSDGRMFCSNEDAPIGLVMFLHRSETAQAWCSSFEPKDGFQLAWPNGQKVESHFLCRGHDFVSVLNGKWWLCINCGESTKKPLPAGDDTGVCHGPRG
jgi:hypothetical protein